MNSYTSNITPQSACHGYRAGDSLHYVPKGEKTAEFRRKANEAIARSQARIDARKTVKFTPNPNYKPTTSNTFTSNRSDRAFTPK